VINDIKPVIAGHDRIYHSLEAVGNDHILVSGDDAAVRVDKRFTVFIGCGNGADHSSVIGESFQICAVGMRNNNAFAVNYEG
jgi:hypothetical protein